MEVLKEAEGRTDVDEALLAEVHNQPPPSEVDVESMTEPTAEQKQNFAPPQGYYAPDSKADYAHLGQEGYLPPPPQGQGSYPTHPTHGSYQPTDYPPPPPQPPRPTSSSNPTHPQAGYAPPSYEDQQGHGAYGGGGYEAPTGAHQPGAAPQESTSQAPYFPPPPAH